MVFCPYAMVCFVIHWKGRVLLRNPRYDPAALVKITEIA